VRTRRRLDSNGGIRVTCQPGHGRSRAVLLGRLRAPKVGLSKASRGGARVPLAIAGLNYGNKRIQGHYGD